jgi:hypothetical protein
MTDIFIKYNIDDIEYYKCINCYFYTKFLSSIRRHINHNNCKESYNCEYCKKKFKSKLDKDIHLNKKKKCFITCNYIITDKYNSADIITDKYNDADIITDKYNVADIITNKYNDTDIITNKYNDTDIITNKYNDDDIITNKYNDTDIITNKYNDTYIITDKYNAADIITDKYNSADIITDKYNDDDIITNKYNDDDIITNKYNDADIITNKYNAADIITNKYNAADIITNKINNLNNIIKELTETNKSLNDDIIEKSDTIKLLYEQKDEIVIFTYNNFSNTLLEREKNKIINRNMLSYDLEYHILFNAITVYRDINDDDLQIKDKLFLTISYMRYERYNDFFKSVYKDYKYLIPLIIDYYKYLKTVDDKKIYGKHKDILMDNLLLKIKVYLHIEYIK